MKQFSLNMSPEFSKQIKLLMKSYGTKHKVEAIRRAVSEAYARLIQQQKGNVRYSDWIGDGLRNPLNSNPRFKSDDDLWS